MFDIRNSVDNLRHKAWKLSIDAQSKLPLPYIKTLEKTINSMAAENNNLLKENTNLLDLTEDYRARVEELQEERGNYKEAADNLALLAKELQKDLNLARTLGSPELAIDKYNNLYRKGTSHMGDNRRAQRKDDYDEFFDAIKIKGALHTGDISDEEKKIFPLEESPFTKDYPKNVNIDINKLKRDRLGDQGTDEDAINVYDKERRGEADFLRKYFRNNHPLSIKALNNSNRVEAEIEKSVPQTSTALMEPRRIYNLDDLKSTNDPRASAEEYLTKGYLYPENVAKAEVKLYDHGRMRLFFYDEDGNVMNPSIEDTIVNESPAKESLWQRFINSLTKEKEA